VEESITLFILWQLKEKTILTYSVSLTHHIGMSRMRHKRGKERE
jgi:hypothetical protein